MKFVPEEQKLLKSEDTVQLGNEETKQPAEEKLQTTSKEVPKEGTVKTLVNFRKDPSMNSKVIDTIKGGEIIKILSSNNFSGFTFVEYKFQKGYVKSEYIMSILKVKVG